MKVVTDQINPESPQEVSLTESVTGNGYAYVYRYTGRGHGEGDTNLYFYLPVSSIGQSDPPSGDTEENPQTGQRSLAPVWLLIFMALAAFSAALIRSGRSVEKGQT